MKGKETNPFACSTPILRFYTIIHTFHQQNLREYVLASSRRRRRRARRAVPAASPRSICSVVARAPPPTRAARIVDNRCEARTRDARRPDGGRSGRRTAMIPRSAPFATRAIDASRRKKKCARTRERARASSARGRTASARFQGQPFAVRPSPASGANDSPRRLGKSATKFQSFEVVCLDPTFRRRRRRARARGVHCRVFTRSSS